MPHLTPLHLDTRCRSVELPTWADPDVQHCLGLIAPQESGDSCEVDPQAWLFAERARYRETGVCDPWAEHLLRRAGLLPNS